MSVEFYFRIAGMIVLGIAGVWFGISFSQLAGEDPMVRAVAFGMVGWVAGLVLTPYFTTRPTKAIRKTLTQISARALFAGILGLVISLVVSALLAFPLSLLPKPFGQVLPVVLAIFMCYLGISIFVSRQTDIFQVWASLSSKSGGDGKVGEALTARTILMDTSVIIDGRVADIARTGFLPGELLIPRFVLNELQYIADSGDNLRRQRGRRGLEVLSQLQKDTAISVRISDIDVEGTNAVDDKLVILARQMKAPVLTNDYNLNRVAELQGVMILNINELANAVKAVYLPGENLDVRVIQEGREPGQGIGYLDDGTMVVVQDGNHLIGKEVNTIVTKVLQTAAGRMIFSKPDEQD
ncbi:MAG TPA: PIN domain-containing protein [Anaerolineales bacterium]|nr:PIN domain-containing protein [Anaerolineales bacterium]